MATGAPLDDRLIRLESTVMHLEHELSQLRDALRVQHEEIVTLQRALRRARADFDEADLRRPQEPSAPGLDGPRPEDRGDETRGSG
jgi:hypothetical protein